MRVPQMAAPSRAVQQSEEAQICTDYCNWSQTEKTLQQLLHKKLFLYLSIKKEALYGMQMNLHMSYTRREKTKVNMIIYR